MFRKEVKDRILRILSRSKLTEHAFQVKFADKASEPLVRIKYVLLESFSFTAGLSGDNHNFWVTCAPGSQLVIEETSRAETIEEVISSLESWVSSVEVEDDVSADIDNDVSKLKEVFFRDLSRHVKDENRHFTKEEADELTARIEKLEQQIEQIMAQQKKSESEVRSVKRLMQDAKKDAGTLTKRKWLVVGGGKIFNALISIATSKEGRKAIVDSVKGYLGEKNP